MNKKLDPMIPSLSLSTTIFSFSINLITLTWHHAHAPHVWQVNQVIACIGCWVIIACDACYFEDNPLAVQVYDLVWSIRPKAYLSVYCCVIGISLKHVIGGVGGRDGGFERGEIVGGEERIRERHVGLKWERFSWRWWRLEKLHLLVLRKKVPKGRNTQLAN